MKWLTKNRNRIFIFLILILFVNLNIKAETEAERRASIRYFQEHLDREEKKTQQEADRVYNERYGPGKRPPNTFGDDLIGLSCIGSFCLFVLFLIAPDFVINIFTSISDLFSSKPEDSKMASRDYGSGGISTSESDPKYTCERGQVGYDYVNNLKQHSSDIGKINRLEYGAKGSSHNDSDYQEYLSELRKPLNPSKNNFVEGLPAGFSSKSKDQSDSIDLFPCPGCGGMIESAGLSDCVMYTCPHCEKYLSFKKGFGLSVIETSPCCYCRQPIIIDGLLKNSVVDCPHCSEKLR